MPMFRVCATVEHTTDDGWHGAPQIPTFYVEASSQQEASKKVDDILNPVGYVTAVHASIMEV